jgi:hypothetical protein
LKVWALDYKRVPHVRHTLLPGLHAAQAKRLSGDTSTTPVLTIDGRSIGDSTQIPRRRVRNVGHRSGLGLGRQRPELLALR